jgi:hypothetical protein
VRRIVTWILLATGALAPVARVSAQEGAGSIELRLLDAPSARREDPRARSYVIDHVHPGDSISRRIAVVNRTKGSVRVELYSGGAELERGGFIPMPGRGGNELAMWTTISPGSVEISPAGEALATVRIAVPRNASEGERYGVAWAQLPKSTPENGGASQVNRVGIRIYLSVGPGGEPPSDFVIDSVIAERIDDGTPAVVAQVRNTGGRALDMAGSLRLTDGPGGVNAGPFPAKLGTTLGLRQTGRVRVPLNRQLPDGPWDAKITMRSGLVERSASATIRFPRGEGAAKPVEVKSPSSLPLGVVVGVVLGLVLLVLLFLLFYRRRRRKRDAEQTTSSR